MDTFCAASGFQFGGFILLILCYFPSAWAQFCGGNFLGNGGVIESPRFPQSYPAGQNCRYAITVPKHRRVVLKWESFSVNGQMPNCTQPKDDSVTIYSGCSSVYIGTFCSLNAGKPHGVFSPDNCMLVAFLSSRLSRGGHFKALYHSVPANVDTGSLECIAGRDEINSGVFFTSLWPSPYRNILGPCKWSISVDRGYVILLNVMSFSLMCKGNLQDHILVYDAMPSHGRHRKRLIDVFSCERRPFQIETHSSRIQIQFEIKNHYNTHATGFAIGYVAYKPAVRKKSSADYENIFLVTFSIVLLVILVFFKLKFGTAFNKCLWKLCPQRIRPRQRSVSQSGSYIDSLSRSLQFSEEPQGSGMEADDDEQVSQSRALSPPPYMLAVQSPPSYAEAISMSSLQSVASVESTQDMETQDNSDEIGVPAPETVCLDNDAPEGIVDRNSLQSNASEGTSNEPTEV